MIVAGASLWLVLSAPAPLAAQVPVGRRPVALIGLGGAMPLSEPGIERRVGAAAMVAVELPAARALWLRAEVSADAQDLDTRADGPVSGDLQQVRLVGAARYAPVALGRFRPYALAGGGLFWQSERIVLRDQNDPVPDAAYRETSSRTAAGVLLGGGATVALSRTQLFAEARLTRVGTENGSTSDITVLGGVTLPLPW